MKKEIIIVMAGITALSFFSCSNDDTTEKEQEEQEVAIRESLKTQGLMNALCQVDSLENGIQHYTPRIGTPIDPTTPTVFYTIGNDMNYARQTFQGIISSLISEEESSYEVYDIKQGNIHLTFSESSASGEVARIKVDCPELKNVLTDIVFITKERWPTNDLGSPFNLLSIWKHNGLFYVCVRAAESADGIMLTLEGGSGQEWFKTYNHWQGQFWLYTNTASATAFNCLVNTMNNLPEQFRTMLSYMNKAGGPNVWQMLFDGKQYWFDRDYTYTHGIFWGYYCYYVDLNKTHIWKIDSYQLQHYTHHFEHKETPVRSTASSQVGFSPDFNKSDWECIYEGE